MVGGIELLRRFHLLRVPHKAVETGAQATVGPAEERIYDIVAMVCLAECLYVLVNVCVGVCVCMFMLVCADVCVSVVLVCVNVCVYLVYYSMCVPCLC